MGCDDAGYASWDLAQVWDSGHVWICPLGWMCTDIVFGMMI